jgi:hypothetical protein
MNFDIEEILSITSKLEEEIDFNQLKEQLE